ncbi:hypothetical protein TNCV_4256711 [Trichonephila clavipes]|nr:hypothetical protein TNCV_4256711 [Trichonephila clavipes]
MTDSESDMDLNSEKSGYTYKSRSSCSGTSKSATHVSDCQKLKKAMEKIPVADQAINCFENQICNPPSGDPTDVYISFLAQKRQERETLVRELQILPSCADPDDSFLAQAEFDEDSLVKIPQTADLKKRKNNGKKNKAQKALRMQG